MSLKYPTAHHEPLTTCVYQELPLRPTSNVTDSCKHLHKLPKLPCDPAITDSAEARVHLLIPHFTALSNVTTAVGVAEDLQRMQRELLGGSRNCQLTLPTQLLYDRVLTVRRTRIIGHDRRPKQRSAGRELKFKRLLHSQLKTLGRRRMESCPSCQQDPSVSTVPEPPKIFSL